MMHVIEKFEHLIIPLEAIKLATDNFADKNCIGGGGFGTVYKGELVLSGTFGYCDPLYVETGLLTKESDVYSFGDVLFEILCGRLSIGNNSDERRPLVGLVRQYYEEGNMSEIIHANLKDEITSSSLLEFTEIAYQCLKRDLRSRPIMTDVVSTLERALQYQTGRKRKQPASSGPASNLGTAKMRNVREDFTFMEVKSVRASAKKVVCCHFSSDGELLASGGHDKKPDFSLHTFIGHSASVMSLDFHPNRDDLICSCDRTGGIRYWSIQNGSCTRVFKGHLKPIQFVCWDPNGEYLASSLELWNMLENKAMTLSAHEELICGMAVSTATGLVASASHDKIVKLWK
ncbi:hypothetical protein L1987_04947 [Smallanthus sonchifolius]|uniref:Uncharacterized protein n=1 Tax=Smallanthus sonchifolius TaxID=185202 RepID=A0ACB9JTZ5_9ASTR|nr:hypothetical protein L1987_04947 [Smallanthus sonchifolius]